LIQKLKKELYLEEIYMDKEKYAEKVSKIEKYEAEIDKLYLEIENLSIW